MLKEGSIGVGKRVAAIPSPRLLLVDDDPALLVALSGTLQSRFGPCTVDACESGMQALDLIEAHTYDTIVTDVTMPGMNGWQFLRAVKQSHSDTPVLLMSGRVEQAVMAEALEAGASSFFTKPFDRDAFVAAVRDGVELFRLNRVRAIENSLFRRATSHHATLVETLHHHDGAYARLAQDAPVPPGDEAFQRRIAYRSMLVRHMAVLEKFVLNLAEMNSRTLSRVSAVHEKMYRHAVTRLQAGY